MNLDDNKIKNIIEAALMAVAAPMSLDKIMQLFGDDEKPSNSKVKAALDSLKSDYDGRGVELVDVASGYRFQSRQEYSEWLSRLWEERPAKYSRATLETLALIAYRQPVTRAEIEDVRGVGVSSSIIKTMIERDWIRVVGHRDVPGRPALYATTKQFLDYFNMKSLEDLPSLAEIKDLEDLNPELDLPDPDEEREGKTLELPSDDQVENELDENQAQASEDVETEEEQLEQLTEPGSNQSVETSEQTIDSEELVEPATDKDDGLMDAEKMDALDEINAEILDENLDEKESFYSSDDSDNSDEKL